MSGMTAPQRKIIEAMILCAKTEPGCEAYCPYAKNEKFCQRALLHAAGKMMEGLISKNEELKAEITDLRYELKSYDKDWGAGK